MEQETSYHHGDLRRALIQAAIAKVRQEGADRLTLRGVARAASVSHAAPYHHFKDKAALLAAVAEEGFVALQKTVDARTRTMENPDLSLQEAAVAYVSFAAENAHLFRVMFGPQLADKSAFPSLQAAAESAFLTIGGLGKSGPPDSASDARTSRLAVSSWAVTHGLAMLLIDGQFGVSNTKEVERLARDVTDVFWVGLSRYIVR